MNGGNGDGTLEGHAEAPKPGALVCVAEFAFGDRVFGCHVALRLSMALTNNNHWFLFVSITIGDQKS